jgi:membrane-bound lytic murein transglycosylase D
MKFCIFTGLAIIGLAFFLFTGNSIATENKDNFFPIYESIKPNIAFWKKVYSEYTTSQVIIHDRRNLTLIYEIIQIKGKDELGAQKYNKKLLNDKRNYYSRLLKRLSAGHVPTSAEEKRIHELFSNNNLRHLLKDANDNIRTQLGQKDRFLAGLIRSGSYIEEIREILKGYGVPEDLAYLPHVESSYDYQAYSKFGAAGIWQFTNSTGRRFLKIDYTIDERRDPILATHAAAKFLKENYDMLGTWPVAITAYNHGPQGMQRAVKTKGGYESIYNKYESRSFGFASRNFYSEFLAAREVASNSREYFGDVKVNDPVKRVMVSTPGNVAIKELAKYYKFTVGTLKDLNPALREPVFSNQKYVPKGSRLFLPLETASEIKTATIDIPSQLLKADQKPSHFYRVKKGDTANRIAREHNVKLHELIDANQLNSRATIFVGQNLRIPSADEKTALASSDMNSTTVIPSDEKKPVSQSTDNNLEETKTTPIPETIDEVADNPAKESIDSSVGPVLSNPTIMTGDFSVKNVVTVKGKTVGVIHVEPEETIGRYADWVQTDSSKIRKLNGFSASEGIRIGQKIKIPLNNISKETFEEKRFEYHKEIEEDFFASYRVERTEEYIIKKGDNLWSLCDEKFEVPFWLLKKYNPKTDFNRLSNREKLIVPVISKIGDETGIN